MPIADHPIRLVLGIPEHDIFKDIQHLFVLFLWSQSFGCLQCTVPLLVHAWDFLFCFHILCCIPLISIVHALEAQCSVLILLMLSTLRLITQDLDM